VPKELEISIDSSESMAGLRLDAFLPQLAQIPSRSFASKLLQQQCVKVNDNFVKASYKLKPGDKIYVVFPDLRKSDLIPESIPLNIIYEDDDLLVINKQRGLVVHPGAGHATGTLIQALIHYCGKLSSIGGEERPGIVHRLDKGTSGLMVIAKNDLAHIGLSEQFKQHSITKIYRAIVAGRVTPLNQEIKNKIIRSEKNRKKFAVHPARGREAVSKYHVLKQSKLLSYLEIQIFTGRTHQIRVHLSHKGFPLVGDILYGYKKSSDKTIDSEFPFLHAYRLEFTHPITGKKMKFKVDPPPDFDQVLKKLKDS